MSSEIWVSSVSSQIQLFNKPGIREKHYGQDWAQPKFEKDAPTQEQYARLVRYGRGEKLKREEFVEAAYVFSPKHWAQVKDLFALAGFYVVKGRLAKLLKDFDLGGGELVQFPIYEADKVSRLQGPFYFLNFGAQKDCVLPKESKNVEFLVRNKDTGQELWAGPIEPKDDDIAVSASALSGADLWIDPKLTGKIFMSGELHDAIEAAKLNFDFQFSKTRIVQQ